MKMIPRTYRIPVELDNGLKDRAAEEGRNESDVVRDSLRRYLESPVPANGAPSPTGSSGTAGLEARGDMLSAGWPEGGWVDAARWLADRTGRPRAVCAGLILAGRVSVDGRPITGLAVPGSWLEGSPVVSGGSGP
jgi:anti-sigma factor RsiW